MFSDSSSCDFNIENLFSNQKIFWPWKFFTSLCPGATRSIFDFIRCPASPGEHRTCTSVTFRVFCNIFSNANVKALLDPWQASKLFEPAARKLDKIVKYTVCIPSLRNYMSHQKNRLYMIPKDRIFFGNWLLIYDS